MGSVTMKGKHPARQATLRDIATATNLTVATVSRILAGKAKFAPETRERVEAVANALGYRPNRLVAGIQTGRTGMIGCIVPIHAEWGATMTTGLQQALAPHGYVPIVLDCPSTVMNELEMIHHLLDRRVEGVLLFPADDTVSDEYFDEIRSRRVPLVVVDRRLNRARTHFVGCYDRTSGRLAAEHLVGLGHRTLGHLAGPWTISTGRERAEGFFQTALASAGTSVSQAIMPTFLPDEQLIEAFLTDHPAVTGIYCANEPIALGLCAAARRRGLQIPRDLSIVSHGNFRAASLVTPALTSTCQHSLEIGREAANLLLELINGRIKTDTVQDKRVPTELIVRESTAPPRTD
jgi:LacI family transcriptional regulator